MGKNRMAEVARMFGKELGEPFKVKYLGEVITMEFTLDGLKSSELTYHGESIDFDGWHVLITGMAEIVGE